MWEAFNWVGQGEEIPLEALGSLEDWRDAAAAGAHEVIPAGERAVLIRGGGCCGGGREIGFHTGIRLPAMNGSYSVGAAIAVLSWLGEGARFRPGPHYGMIRGDHDERGRMGLFALRQNRR